MGKSIFFGFFLCSHCFFDIIPHGQRLHALIYSPPAGSARLLDDVRLYGLLYLFRLLLQSAAKYAITVPCAAPLI